jgi:hypothetical protein
VPFAITRSTVRPVGLNDLATRAPLVIDAIAKHLTAIDLINLASSTPALANAVTNKAINHAAQRFIAQRERGPTPWPALCDTRRLPSASELAEGGFNHTVILLNLHNALAALPFLSLDKATHIEIPGVILRRHGPVRSTTTEPAFITSRPFAHGNLSFVMATGESTAPIALAGREVVSKCDTELLHVVDTGPGSARGDTLLVRDTNSGAVGAYNVSINVLNPLALAPMASGDLGAMSEDGRMVAALYRGNEGTDSRLKVLDGSADRIVTDMPLRGSRYVQLAVDSSGTALVTGPHQTLAIAPGNDQRMPCDPHGSACTLGPGENYLVALAQAKSDIVMEHRGSGHTVTLTHPNSTTTTRARALALSPGRAMAATTYTDGSVAIFDLTGDEAQLCPRACFQLPAKAAGSIPSFERDGSFLYVAYSKPAQAQCSALTGIVCLALTGGVSGD